MATLGATRNLALAGIRPMSPVQAPTPPPLPEELTAVLHRVRLPYVRAAAPEGLATARAQRWDPGGRTTFWAPAGAGVRPSQFPSHSPTSGPVR